MFSCSRGNKLSLLHAWYNTTSIHDRIFFKLIFIVYPSVTCLIMKGQQAFGEVTRALMRKQHPYRSRHPGAHLCPAMSMVDTWPYVHLTDRVWSGVVLCICCVGASYVLRPLRKVGWLQSYHHRCYHQSPVATHNKKWFVVFDLTKDFLFFSSA